jgi:integrase
VLSFQQAQKKVRALFVAGSTPAGPLTVRQAVERYVAYLRAKKKTGTDAANRLAKHVLPTLGDRPVAALTEKELEACTVAMVRHDPSDPEVARRSKDTANRCLAAFRAALNMAFYDTSNGIASDTAWRRGLRPFPKVARARECFLDQTQANRLVNVCKGGFRNLVTAALLTGARPPHELAGCRVRDFRADLRTLTIVDGKTGHRDIVLTQEAVAFFTGTAAGREPDALLLPRDDGTKWGKNMHIKPMNEAVVRAKLPKDCSIYSLRHTHASQSILLGVNIKFLAENMGTSIVMLEKSYGKFLAASRREMIETAGFKLGLPAGKVAPLRARPK